MSNDFPTIKVLGSNCIIGVFNCQFFSDKQPNIKVFNALQGNFSSVQQIILCNVLFFPEMRLSHLTTVMLLWFCRKLKLNPVKRTKLNFHGSFYVYENEWFYFYLHYVYSLSIKWYDFVVESCMKLYTLSTSIYMLPTCMRKYKACTIWGVKTKGF